MENVLRDVVKLAGGCPLSKLVSTLKVGIASPSQTHKLERQVAGLTSEVAKLKDKLRASEKECHQAKERANDSARALMEVEEVIRDLGEVFLKAKLWDDKVSQDERLSRSKVLSFITTYAVKVESALQDMTTIVRGISVAVGMHGSSSDPSGSASVSLDMSQQERRVHKQRGKEIVVVGTSEEPEYTPHAARVTKSISSVRSKEAVSTLQHLKATEDPSVAYPKEEPISFPEVEAALKIGVDTVLGRPATHALVLKEATPEPLSQVTGSATKELDKFQFIHRRDRTAEQFPDVAGKSKFPGIARKDIAGKQFPDIVGEGFPEVTEKDFPDISGKNFADIGQGAESSKVERGRARGSMQVDEEDVPPQRRKDPTATSSIFVVAAPIPPRQVPRPSSPRDTDSPVRKLQSGSELSG